MLAVTPYYEPEGGGLERYAHALLRRLAAKGHEVRALAFTKAAPGEEERDGVHLRRLKPRWRLSNTPLDPSFGGVVREELRAHAPDVLVAHTPVPFPAEMACLAAAKERVPFVVTYHAGKLEGGAPLLDALAAVDRATLERRMLTRAARLIAVSPFVRDHALRAHHGRVTVIPPGVETRHFVPGLPPRSHDILFVGPLDSAYRWKGLDTLWAAFHRLRADLPDARLVLVGDGDRRAALERQAQEEGLGRSIVFRGRLPPDDLMRAYQDCAVATLPSTSPAESFGMVLAEANACGRPVVGSRVGGIPDFVQEGVNGLLAAPGDAEDLAGTLLRVLRDPDLSARLGSAGRELVVRHHDWDDLASRTEDLLEAAASAQPHAAVTAA